ncbi:MAG: hypothetical protein IJV15_10250 [Lachnospiraceae bacterium]|nr:hypothetical protein [Lachnospiraceae bacterium]
MYDQGVTDFISDCEKASGINNLSDNFTLKSLRCYAKIDVDDYKNPPRNTGYSVFKFIGAHFPDEGQYSLPLYTYEEYGLLFIGDIETMTME